MKDFFVIFVFLGILMLFASSSRDERTLSGADISRENSESSISGSTTDEPQPILTPQEAEVRIAELYDDLKELKLTEREKKLWGTPSPYRELIDLRAGDVWSKDPDTEYLVLRSTGANGSSINISDWYLESYVTKERAGIPQGDRVIEKWRSPKFEDIYLAPNEEALLITGDSPIDASFRENMCTGYLNEEEDFLPPLSNRCASPMEELESYCLIKLDDDKCYDFIERLGTCEIPEERDVPGGRCTLFAENTFNYNDCVENHKNEPFFTRDGYWYVYLGRNDELWRGEREIIRLIDENNRVVDVLEY